jgi:hypothetical protein
MAADTGGSAVESVDDHWAALLEHLTSTRDILRGRHPPQAGHRWVRNDVSLLTYQRMSKGQLEDDGMVRAGAFMLANAADAVRSLRTWGHLADLKIAELCDGALAASKAEQFLVSCMLLRAIIEHVGALLFVTKIVESKVPPDLPSDPKAAWPVLLALDEEVRRGYLGTRFPWNAVTRPDIPFAKLAGEKVVPPPGMANMESKNVKTFVDKLDRDVPGAGSAYALLCEFSHPAMGGNLAFIRSMTEYRDSRNLPWCERATGAGFPRYGFSDRWASALFRNTFRVLRELLPIAEDHVRTRERLLAQTLPIVQTVVRALMQKFAAVWDPYEVCPCESGKKVRFCCGAKDSK